MSKQNEPLHPLRKRLTMVAGAAFLGVVMPVAINVGLGSMGDNEEHFQWVRADITDKVLRESVKDQIRDNSKKAGEMRAGERYTFNIQAQGTLDANEIERRARAVIQKDRDDYWTLSKMEAALFAPVMMFAAWQLTRPRRRGPGPDAPKL